MISNTLKYRNSFIKRLLITTTTFGIVLSSAVQTLAQYRPPPPSPPPRSATATGTRGNCGDTSQATLTALAPTTHVGRTSTTHPTLAWFVPESKSYPIKVRLYTYGANRSRQLIYQDTIQSTLGIMTWTMPATEPGLLSGQRYGWQVILSCDPNHPSSDQVIEAEMDVVAADAALVAALATAADPVARATLYAEAGFWYDALQVTFAADENLQNVRLNLLESLKDLEVPTPNQPNRVLQLEQVIEAERLTASFQSK